MVRVSSESVIGWRLLLKIGTTDGNVLRSAMKEEEEKGDHKAVLEIILNILEKKT